jgi:hypothetical protein
MNIESLISKIEFFEDLIFESGFRRDVQDYIQSIQQVQNQNLVFLKDLSNKVKLKLHECENYELDSELKLVLRDTKPFTELDTLTQLEELDSDTTIEGAPYFSKFNQILNQLLQNIDKNKKETDSVLAIFQKYVSDDQEYNSDGEQAVVSLIFKDLKSTSNLKEFSKVLNGWNRMLLVYHMLLTSESPDEISLVEIQNGSIDVIFNIDFDIAIDLTELIKIGLKVYGAYLLYKSKTAREIIASYMGNQKLIKQEKGREKLMLDNIKESITLKALEQHKERLKSDKKIDKTSIDVKIEEVSSVITDHIIKGNELKLLTLPKTEDENDINVSDELREETATVRHRFKKLNQKERQLLLDKYSIKDEDKKE